MSWQDDIIQQLEKRDSPIEDYKIIMTHLDVVQDRLSQLKVENRKLTDYNEELKEERKSILKMKQANSPSGEITQIVSKEKDEQIMELTNELKEHYKKEMEIHRKERQLQDKIDTLQQKLNDTEIKLNQLSQVKIENEYNRELMIKYVTEITKLKDEIFGLQIELNICEEKLLKTSPSPSLSTIIVP